MSFSSSLNLASGAFLSAPPLIRSRGRSWSLESVPCKQKMGDRKTSAPWSPTGCCLVLLPHMCVLLVQSSLTLCNPMDCSPWGSSVHGISQARILEWVAIFYSRGSSKPRDWTQVSLIAGRFFTVWATGFEDLTLLLIQQNELVPESPLKVYYWDKERKVSPSWLEQTAPL